MADYRRLIQHPYRCRKKLSSSRKKSNKREKAASAAVQPWPWHRSQGKVCLRFEGSASALREDKALHSAPRRALCLWDPCHTRIAAPAPRVPAPPGAASLRVPIRGSSRGSARVAAAADAQPRLPEPQHAPHPCRHLWLPGLGTGRCLLTPAPLAPRVPRSKSWQTCQTCRVTPLLLIHHSPPGKLPRSYCRGLVMFSQPSRTIPVITRGDILPPPLGVARSNSISTACSPKEPSYHTHNTKPDTLTNFHVFTWPSVHSVVCLSPKL